MAEVLTFAGIASLVEVHVLSERICMGLVTANAATFGTL